MTERRLLPWHAGALLLLVAAGCASPKKLAEGADCAQATDCEDGLICVPVRGGTRVCSRDLEGLGKPPDRPAGDAGKDEDGGDGGASDAEPSDATRG